MTRKQRPDAARAFATSTALQRQFCSWQFCEKAARRVVVADGIRDRFYCWPHAVSRVDELNWAPDSAPEGTVAEE